MLAGCGCESCTAPLKTGAFRYSGAWLSRHSSGHAAGRTCSRGESECGPVHVGRPRILKHAANVSSYASLSAEEPVVGTHGPREKNAQLVKEYVERSGREEASTKNKGKSARAWHSLAVSPASLPTCRTIRSAQHGRSCRPLVVRCRLGQNEHGYRQDYERCPVQCVTTLSALCSRRRSRFCLAESSLPQTACRTQCQCSVHRP